MTQGVTLGKDPTMSQPCLSTWGLCALGTDSKAPSLRPVLGTLLQTVRWG